MAIGGAAVGLEVSGHGDDRHTKSGRVADLHADAVVQAGPVQQREHPIDAAQPFGVKLEQATALARVGQFLLVGVAKRKEDCVGADVAGETVSVKVVGEGGGLLVLSAGE